MSAPPKDNWGAVLKWYKMCPIRNTELIIKERNNQRFIRQKIKQYLTKQRVDGEM